ncbi:hypothetical protein PGTUg99_018062 [Puccinia graminis f. sp. tritici]|uniref:DUF7143 domain-containing protein n=2 Tax=Puccinia graminis f. sp. tritici TaxID=56615 RepID=A0A5B0SB61_PUCGR|nr:hypothetical protein PGTUg99_018062 [Puccinia graminis f. sp. tritici]
MLKTAFSILLTLLAVETATAAPFGDRNSTGPQPFQEKPCYMTGRHNVPHGVIINTHVQCLEGSGPFHDIPDVVYDNMQYSVYDYQKYPNLSPVGFALEYFTPHKRTKSITKALENLMVLYGATNAGLRSWGEARSNDVKKIKGPSFYLAFQHAISVDNLELAADQLKKVLKNCVDCKHGERERVIKIARQNNVKVPESLESDSQSLHSQSLIDSQ